MSMAGRFLGLTTGGARRAYVLLFFVGLLAGCATPAQQRAARGELPAGRIAALQREGPPTRVLLISVAGLEASDFLAPGGFIAQPGQPVRMPRLAVLAGEGVVGERAQVPSPGSILTSHATLATGRLPARHGVIGEGRLLEDGRIEGYYERTALEGDAIWDAAIGRGVLALGWPSTIGARIELLLPALGPLSPGGGAAGEGRWLDRARRTSSSWLVRMLEEIEADAMAESRRPGKANRAADSWPSPAERDAAFTELACEVARSDRDPGLWMIRLAQTEAAQRGSGSGSKALAEALRAVDAEIGSLIDCLAESDQLAETAIVVVGDVTYRAVHSRVEPNVALVQKGLIGRDPRASTGVRSWLAQVRSHGRSAYVYAKNAPSALAARELLEEEAVQTGGFRVVPASELATGAVDPQAWFGLEAAPGFEIGDGLVRPVLRPAASRAREGALGLGPSPKENVGFLAWGRGIRSEIRLPELSLADLAPTISLLLGLRLDAPIDGRPIAGILRAAVPPPPPGPKRIGVGDGKDVDRTLERMGGGRR